MLRLDTDYHTCQSDVLLKKDTGKEHGDGWDTHRKDWSHMVLRLSDTEGDFGFTFNDVSGLVTFPQVRQVMYSGMILRTPPRHHHHSFSSVKSMSTSSPGFVRNIHHHLTGLSSQRVRIDVF